MKIYHNNHYKFRWFVVFSNELSTSHQSKIRCHVGRFRGMSHRSVIEGTEAETKEFMAVCINTVAKYNPTDLRSPVFIFERLCNLIRPEESDTSEFLIILEKDPQQEDFLQVPAASYPPSLHLPPSLLPTLSTCIHCLSTHSPYVHHFPPVPQFVQFPDYAHCIVDLVHGLHLYYYCFRAVWLVTPTDRVSLGWAP